MFFVYPFVLHIVSPCFGSGFRLFLDLSVFHISTDWIRDRRIDTYSERWEITHKIFVISPQNMDV